MRLWTLLPFGLALALGLASLGLGAQAPGVARTGEVYEAPNQVFKVVFKQPGSREFAKYVGDHLQKAWETYNELYKRDNGKVPLGYLTPQNRMDVQIVQIGGSTNAEYKFLSWNGYIQVDPAIGEKNLYVLKISLYHELFHALQDAYANMYVAGNRAHWWYEASAEWAGLKYGSKDSPQDAKDEITRYKYFMSVPIQASRSYEGGLLSYGFALMIDFAERKNPGYVHRVLNGRSASSNDYYEELVREAGFGGNFYEYASLVMRVALPDPGLWTSGRILESEGETRIYRVKGNRMGQDEDPQPQRITEDKARSATQAFSNHHLPLSVMEPLTTRFYSITAGALKVPRTVRIQMREPVMEAPGQSKPLNTAVIFKVPMDPAQKHSYVPLGSSGTVVQGLGKDWRQIWVGVYNPHPNRGLFYDLDITLEKGFGEEFLLEPLSFETVNEETKEWEGGQSGSTLTSKWKIEADGLWFDSRQDGFHLEASWSKPPVSLKQGDGCTMDITLTAQGPRGAELQISPTGPMSEWELEVRDPGPGIRKAAMNTWVLSLAPGTGRRSITANVQVSLPGPWTTVNLKTGEGSGGRRRISVDLLDLCINVNNLGKIHWSYAKKGAFRWWDKKR